MRGITRGLVAAAAACLLAVSCGDDDSTSTTSTTDVPATTATTTATATTATATTTATDVPLLIVLTPDGVGFTTEDSGSISRIDFGSDQQLTRDAVVKALGQPIEESPQPECPPGPADISRFDGLSLTFIDGSFVGWELPAGSTQTMIDGIGLGSTRADLSNPTVEETSLGTEFTSGEVHGILSDDTPNGEITALWVGTICAFR